MLSDMIVQFTLFKQQKHKSRYLCNISTYKFSVYMLISHLRAEIRTPYAWIASYLKFKWRHMTQYFKSYLVYSSHTCEFRREIGKMGGEGRSSARYYEIYESSCLHCDCIYTSTVLRKNAV